LEQIPVPAVDFPAGFEAHNANYMAQGVCPDCCSRC
jgi:hypothetical protein